MNRSIIQLYGLTDMQNVAHHHYLSDKGYLEWENPELSRFVDRLLGNNEITYFIMIKVRTFLERKTPTEMMLEQRFGVRCRKLCETEENDFDGIVRKCVLSVASNQIVELLGIMFEYSYCSFAVFGNPYSSDMLSKLTELFASGILTPKILASCACYTLLNNASFLHVLRGYDGYSINCFSRKIEQGAVRNH